MSPRSIMVMPIATAQRHRAAVEAEFAVGDQLDQPLGGFDARSARRHGRAGSQNSSPPSRATQSVCAHPGEQSARSTGPARRRRPHGRSVSLSILRPSRSTNSIAAGVAVALVAGDHRFELAHQAAAVGERRPADRDAPAGRARSTRASRLRHLARAAARFRRADAAGSRHSSDIVMHGYMPAVAGACIIAD